jgi:APA family basic amino acid/polyamine antiporter
MSMVVPATSGAEAQPVSLKRALSLTDAVLLVIGGVIGSGIFITSNAVAAALPSPFFFLGIWVAGGVVCYMAAVAFAELGAMYPEAGGQYVYLREAFGEVAAFLYGWLMFVAGSTAGISTLTVGFADYLGQVLPFGTKTVVLTTPGFTWKTGQFISSPWHLTRGDLVAVGAIVGLTAINVVGVKRAANFQNVSTWLKYGALAVFVALGFAIGRGSAAHFHPLGIRQAFAGGMYPLLSAAGVAFIAVFWCYDGWVYVSWAAGEIRDPERNIPRALVIGLAGIVMIYVLLNVVYVYALPVSEIAQHETIGQAAAQTLFSASAAFWLSAVIAIACLGAACSNTLAGARVVYAMARDGAFFHRMGEVHPRYRTPAFALMAQGALACVFAVSGTYDQLFTYTVFGMVLSYVATVVAVFVLRRKQPDRPRPYRCAGYPWLPGLYVLLIGGWIVNTVVQRPFEAVSCLVLMAMGLPGFWWWKRPYRKS